jgi:RNA polymerase sigma-70 factor (ECF subfamily)
MSQRSERTMDTSEPLARGGRMDSATEAFAGHRNLLFTVAYEMLGSAADAEDVLQETWLRGRASIWAQCAISVPTWSGSPLARR